MPSVNRQAAIPFADKTRLWVVHMTRFPEIEQRAKSEGFVCVGWASAGDLSRHGDLAQVRVAIAKAYPDWTAGRVGVSATQAFRFATMIEVGDPVVLPMKGAKEYLVGEVIGPYRFKHDDPQLKAADFCNFRPVKWLKSLARSDWTTDAANSFGAASSLSRSDRFLPEVRATLTRDKTRP